MLSLAFLEAIRDSGKLPLEGAEKLHLKQKREMMGG